MYSVRSGTDSLSILRGPMDVANIARCLSLSQTQVTDICNEFEWEKYVYYLLTSEE